MKQFKYLLSSAIAFSTVAIAPSASAFCGFYVAKADTELFNQSSKVALVRDGDRTVITMANDYICLLYTSPSPRDQRGSRMPSSA